MELVSLDLSNFRRFESASLDFGPGINLVFGRNEAGKSTIHEAICCALFGRERSRPVENWSGGTCAVSLTYGVDKKIFRIERRLTEGVVRLGVAKGEELTDVLTGKDEVAAMIAEHLGVSSRVVFHNTVFVRQASLSAPGASEMEVVGGEIQRVLTGAAHVSADEVKKQLEASRDAIKGRARPANPREYDRIEERLRKLAVEVADARASRKSIHDLETEQADLTTRIARDSERLATLEDLLGRHKRWAELTEKEADLDARHASAYDSLDRIRKTAEDMALVQKELEGYTELVGKDVEIADHLTKNAAKREELNSRIAGLDGAEAPESPARSDRLQVALMIAAVVLAAVGTVIGLTLGWYPSVCAYAPALAAGIAGLAVRLARRRRGGGAKCGSLVESARRELEALDREEVSFLAYMKSPDTERAWAKIRSYRNLVSRLHDAEVALGALLGGRKREDWEKEEAALSRELSGVRREIADEFTGYAPTTEESESWRSEYASLQNSLSRAEARLHEVNGSLETERKNARDVAALDGELEYLHARKDELDFVYRAYGEAISALDAVTDRVSSEYLPELSERASRCLERVTSGRYVSVAVQPSWEITADCRDRSGVKPAVLSTGALDQLYFALRLSCGELLSAGRKLPLILDDPFASFDRTRLDKALDLIRLLARENQIILMTHDPHILEWARELESSGKVRCTITELSPP